MNYGIHFYFINVSLSFNLCGVTNMTINIKEYVQKENRLFNSVMLKPIKYQKHSKQNFKLDRLLLEATFTVLWEYLLYQKNYIQTFKIEQFQNVMTLNDLEIIEKKEALPTKLLYMLAQSHSNIQLMHHLRKSQYRGINQFKQDVNSLEDQINHFLSHSSSWGDIIYKPRFIYEPLSLKGEGDFIIDDIFWVFDYTLETVVSTHLHKELIMATLINETKKEKDLKTYSFKQWGIYNPLLNTYEILNIKIPEEVLAVWETMIL